MPRKVAEGPDDVHADRGDGEGFADLLVLWDEFDLCEDEVDEDHADAGDDEGVVGDLFHDVVELEGRDEDLGVGDEADWVIARYVNKYFLFCCLICLIWEINLEI